MTHAAARTRRYTEVVLPLNAHVYVLGAVKKKDGAQWPRPRAADFAFQLTERA